jgi:nicotinamidase-related amidase
MKLDRSRTALVVVDVQEGFRPAVVDFTQMVANVARLVQGARILGLPAFVTEQYPKSRSRRPASARSTRRGSARRWPTRDATRWCCAASRRTCA